ncbi:MAG: alpha/beta hydrolase [Armatimonadetes bacterium]|nr:alpha/beta hydrolase [Armatimonadota bacterium]
MKVQLGSASLNVSQRGKGKPSLLFLHYFGGSSRSWNEVIELLQADFRCIAPDARGFGASDSTPSGWSVDKSADDLDAVLHALQLPEARPVILVGHSMGGKTALALASRRPDYLRAMVLLAPSPPTPEPMEADERERLMASHGQTAQIEKTLRQITARPLPDAIFQRCVEDGLRASAPAWRWWLEEGSREDISARLSQIAVPVLVVAGAQATSITAQVLEREVVSRISGAELEVMPRVRHLLPLEAPEQVAHLIRRQTLD